MAAMSSISLNNTATETRNDFEKSVAYLLPIAEGKNIGANKIAHGRISQVISTVSDVKAGRGLSDVE